MATSIFSDNLQLHQQMLNSRQQPQQQRNNNYNELFTSLVDITQNQGFPGDEFLAGGGDFLHVASQQFPPHQQMNRFGTIICLKYFIECIMTLLHDLSDWTASLELHINSAVLFMSIFHAT